MGEADLTGFLSNFRAYTADLTAKNLQARQIATCIYFLDEVSCRCLKRSLPFYTFPRQWQQQQQQQQLMCSFSCGRLRGVRTSICQLALRVGSTEKDTDSEADTVGCSNLRVEHISESK